MTFAKAGSLQSALNGKSQIKESVLDPLLKSHLIMSTLFKGGSSQYANLDNTLLGIIYGKFLAIAQKWGDMPKVSTYRYHREYYTESFCIINSYAEASSC
jgi:hypothetical protein